MAMIRLLLAGSGTSMDAIHELAQAKGWQVQAVVSSDEAIGVLKDLSQTVQALVVTPPVEKQENLTGWLERNRKYLPVFQTARFATPAAVVGEISRQLNA